MYLFCAYSTPHRSFDGKSRLNPNMKSLRFLPSSPYTHHHFTVSSFTIGLTLMQTPKVFERSLSIDLHFEKMPNRHIPSRLEDWVRQLHTRLDLMHWASIQGLQAFLFPVLPSYVDWTAEH